MIGPFLEELLSFSYGVRKTQLPSACAGSGACAAQVYSETLFLGPPVGDLIAYQAHHHDHLCKSYDLICHLMLVLCFENSA